MPTVVFLGAGSVVFTRQLLAGLCDDLTPTRADLLPRSLGGRLEEPPR